MNTQKFIRSWPALWLWMDFLETHIKGARIDTIYTFRKARLDIHFTKQESAYRLSWEKQGNQATLTFSENFTHPKRRVELLKEIPDDSKVVGVSLHAKDRILQLDISSGLNLRIGFFPTALNIYLLNQQGPVASFLKQAELPHIADEWLNTHDTLPAILPGQTMTRQELLEAKKGFSFDPEHNEITFGESQADSGLDIAKLTISVLKTQQQPKQSPATSVRKSAKTVLKRWQSKLLKIENEFKETGKLPELDIRLQALQIGLGIGQEAHSHELQLAADFSPTGSPLHIQWESGTTLLQEIQATAKKIRKLKGKVDQLQEVIAQIRTDIESLEQLLAGDDITPLQAFLKNHGESLDQAGYRQTERKPYKKYQSPGGFDILVGRASSDNDVLTFKVANKNDWWFHARRVSGSHVILRTGNQVPQQRDIAKAAEHAALNSKAKHSGIVVVQYCQRKHLSKPKGSPPGAVLVHQEKSITIDLDQIK